MSYTGIMITLKNSNNIVENVIGSQLESIMNKYLCCNIINHVEKKNPI